MVDTSPTVGDKHPNDLGTLGSYSHKFPRELWRNTKPKASPGRQNPVLFNRGKVE